MSVPVTQIPVDDFIQPISASTLERVETARIATSANSSTSQIRAVKSDRSNQVSIPKFARHTLGILLLLVTVVLWTASNFLASVGCPHPFPFQQFIYSGRVLMKIEHIRRRFLLQAILRYLCQLIVLLNVTDSGSCKTYVGKRWINPWSLRNADPAFFL